MDMVLIPAYEPDEKLLDVIRELHHTYGLQVLVVNDGSGPDYAGVFAEAAKMATVIELAQNCGKGYALRFGMNYIKTSVPDCRYFVTCDADGQHLPEDVVRVFERLHSGDDFVLTVRRRRHDIPLRSRFGNTLSRLTYALLTNQYLSDNQSGLRGFDVKHIDWMLKVKYDRYEYELNMLYYASKQGIRITTLPIEAIYIGNNESSHFRPVPDTLMLYRCLFFSAFAKFVGLVYLELALLVLSLTIGYHHLFITLPSLAGTCCAINIVLDRFWIFRNVKYKDYYPTMIYTVIYFVIYSLGCMLFRYAFNETVPLIVAFNIVYVLAIPARYYLNKFIHMSTQIH